MNIDRPQFSVYEFDTDGWSTPLARFITANAAIDTVRKVIGSPGPFTARVIITDGGDCLAFEWIRGQGVTDLSKT